MTSYIHRRRNFIYPVKVDYQFFRNISFKEEIPRPKHTQNGISPKPERKLRYPSPLEAECYPRGVTPHFRPTVSDCHVHLKPHVQKRHLKSLGINPINIVAVPIKGGLRL
jgi:hypothetical protein